MGYECFDLDVKDKVAHLVLKRGDELNTMTPAFWVELPEIISSLHRSGETRAIVISSTGKHFTGGLDLSVVSGGGFDGGPGEAEEGRKRANLRYGILKLQESFNVLERARVPVLAAIHGGCVGGGVDMVCACDMRYATADAFFCVQETNIAITADLGTLQRLPKLIPEGLAKEWAYTGDRIPAARAKEAGLVNELFDDHDALVEGTLEIAHRIASKSPLAIWGTKEMVNYARDHSTADALDYMSVWQSGMFRTTDIIEAVAAKGEKRDPDFADLLRLTDKTF